MRLCLCRECASMNTNRAPILSRSKPKHTDSVLSANPVNVHRQKCPAFAPSTSPKPPRGIWCGCARRTWPPSGWTPRHCLRLQAPLEQCTGPAVNSVWGGGVNIYIYIYIGGCRLLSCRSTRLAPGTGELTYSCVWVWITCVVPYIYIP